MAKNKNFLGKFIAFATATAAIGGTCYVFRDKIKAHPLYGKSKEKLVDLYCKVSDRFMSDIDDDDFFDDEYEDVFPTDKGREYTSITINAKSTSDDEDEAFEDEDDFEDDEDFDEDLDEDLDEDELTEDDVEESSDDEDVEDDEDNDADNIPIISFDKARSDSKQSEATAYENEGLSDVSEDPDTLAEQDQLDF